MSDYIDHYSVRFLVCSVLIACALILLPVPWVHAKPVVVGSGSTTKGACKAEGGKIYSDVKTGGFMCCWDAGRETYCERCSDCKPGDEVLKFPPGTALEPRPLKPADKPSGVVKPTKPLKQ